MDKNTLSNYGWIVIAVLVLSVMIALATPFGSYIEQGVRATTEGLFDTSKNAVNSAFEDLGVQMDDQEFEEGYTGVGNTSREPETIAGSATFSDGVTLTWEEVKDSVNGEKYGYLVANTSEPGYDAWGGITDTYIENYAFSMCNNNLISIVIPEGVTRIGGGAFNECYSLKSVTIPSTVTSIGGSCFDLCYELTNITYNGTVAQWNALMSNYSDTIRDKDATVTCTDGTTVLLNSDALRQKIYG